jgi:hypothetical protein
MRAAFVLGVGLLAWPAAAQATDYGGGNAPAGVRQAHNRIVMMAVRTVGDGTAVVRALVQAGCGSGSVQRRVPLAADGSFAFNATVRNRPIEDRRVRRTARLAVAGRVVGAAGSGTASARLVFRRGGRVVSRCRSGVEAWQVRAAAAEPTPAGPRADGSYFGLTNQTEARPHPFVLRVDPRGRRVRTAVFDYRQRCGSRPREWNNISPGVGIAPDGTFRMRERFSIRWLDGTERFRVRVDGRFTANGVSGTLSVTSIVRARGSGRVIGRCRTGPVSFAAAL